MIIAGIIIGLIIGALLGFLYFKSAATKDNLPKNEVEERYVLKELYNSALKDTNEAKASLNAANATIGELKEKTGLLNGEIKSLTDKIAFFNQEAEQLHKQSYEQFKNLANDILEEKTKRFTELNKEKMDAILKPLADKVVEFKEKVEKQSSETLTLKGEIKSLVEMSKKMNEDTVNLTKALKGDSKVQGDWGERILVDLLEGSGLRRNEQYTVQETVTAENGKTLRTDVVISFPDSRKVIIDSKVSLTAYTRYVNAQAPESEQDALKEHIASIKSHIDEINQKNYQRYFPSLDFVIMFVPIEYSLFAALKQNPELWEYAYKKGVLLIGPTNLLAVLKLIQDLWKKEQQNKNAMDIANRGKLLYEKFVGFVENFMQIDTALDKAKNSYDKAFDQLKAGKGNLIEQANKLKELGVKPQKDFPSSLLPEPENSNGEIQNPDRLTKSST
jgi:DNA recombination protein RmuC